MWGGAEGMGNRGCSRGCSRGWLGLDLGQGVKLFRGVLRWGVLDAWFDLFDAQQFIAVPGFCLFFNH